MGGEVVAPIFFDMSNIDGLLDFSLAFHGLLIGNIVTLLVDLTAGSELVFSNRK